MATIVEHKLPIKVFVINNGFLGMVRQWQELFWRRRYSHVGLQNPDFVKLAEAYGCPGYRVQHPSQVEDVIRKAFERTDGPVFVEFVVAQEDNVYPMIPAGQTVNEIIDVPNPTVKPSNGVPEEAMMTVSKGRLIQPMVEQKS
jgi:acetolactate synthase I/II/III large subunit